MAIIKNDSINQTYYSSLSYWAESGSVTTSTVGTLRPGERLNKLMFDLAGGLKQRAKDVIVQFVVIE